MTPRPRGQLTYAQAHSPHRALRRPPLEKINAALRSFPHRTAHAFAQVTPEKVKPVTAVRQVDYPRLLRMQLEPESREHVPHASSRFLNLRLRVTHDHKWSGALARWCTGVPWLCPPFPASCPCRPHHHSVSKCPLIKPDGTISVIRLPDRVHRVACGSGAQRCRGADTAPPSGRRWEGMPETPYHVVCVSAAGSSRVSYRRTSPPS
jgi:hypothetical protein